jgi:D-sedoheptulose 7-phosphate isomerase
VSFDSYLESQNLVLKSVDRGKLDEFIEGLRKIRQNDGFLWVAGNGGACSTASHTAGDFNKTTLNFGGAPVKTIPISDMTALTTAFSNDVSFDENISGPLEILAGPNDGLLLLSVSGTSSNIIRGLESAHSKKITTFSIVGANGKRTADSSTYGIVLDSIDYQIVENAQMTLIHWITKVV